MTDHLSLILINTGENLSLKLRESVSSKLFDFTININAISHELLFWKQGWPMVQTPSLQIITVYVLLQLHWANLIVNRSATTILSDYKKQWTKKKQQSNKWQEKKITKAALQTKSLATTTSEITACATVVMGFKPECWQTCEYKDFSWLAHKDTGHKLRWKRARMSENEPERKRAHQIQQTFFWCYEETWNALLSET